MDTLILDVSRVGGLTDEQLFRLCSSNKNIRIERNQKGELMLMHPTGGGSGYRNSDILGELVRWNKRHKQGIVFDSSTGFTLPNGAMRAPDVAWVTNARWEALSKLEQTRFPPLCPDFLVEVMSESDSLKELQAKMREWMDNGCRLAWLINPKTEKVYIYRTDGDLSVVEGFDNSISGEDVLPDFLYELKELR